jgi:hypothetical protein
MVQSDLLSYINTGTECVVISSIRHGLYLNPGPEIGYPIFPLFSDLE